MKQKRVPQWNAIPADFFVPKREWCMSTSHTSRLFTSSLSLGVPVPRPTQCVRDA
jgi:hypothetical protein